MVVTARNVYGVLSVRPYSASSVVLDLYLRDGVATGVKSGSFSSFAHQGVDRKKARSSSMSLFFYWEARSSMT